MANSTVELPNVGDIVYYKLLPCHLPTERNRKWKGKVIRASINQPRTIDHIKVELLEQGYEGLTELVYLEQIVHVSGDGLYND
jgi:hypothetical protein